MTDDTIIFHALWRNPQYPVILVSSDRLRTAKNLNTLVKACLVSTIPENSRHVTVIDITGDEFWYTPNVYAIAPGFIHKRWTKKRVIDLYNQSVNVRETGMPYSDRSLGNKSLARIITDICALIMEEVS